MVRRIPKTTVCKICKKESINPLRAQKTEHRPNGQIVLVTCDKCRKQLAKGWKRRTRRKG